MRSFASYYRGFLARPRASAEALLVEPRRVRLGACAIAVPALGYQLVYVFLSRSGAYPSTFTPWLNIPAEDYYRYNVYLIVPSILLAWLVAAAVVQLTARALGGAGTFEGTLAVLGFAISIASWSLLPHDLVVGALGAAHVIDGREHEHAMNAPTLARAVLWSFMGLYLVAFLLMFTSVLRAAQGVGRARALVLGVVGFVSYQLIFVLFNR